MSVFGAILSWVTGGGLNALTSSLERAYAAKLSAETDEKRLEAERQIKFLESQVSLAVVAAQNDKWWSTREIMGKVACLVYFKIAAWDTVFGLGSTPNPGSLVTGITLTIIGFYFGSGFANNIAGKILSGIVLKR